MDVLKIIHGAALGQALLIMVLLLTAVRSNLKANIFLLLLLLTMAKSIFFGYARLEGWDIRIWTQWSIYPLFIHGPLVYAYCALMTQKHNKALPLLKHFLWLLFPALWIKLAMYESLNGLKLLHVAAFLQVSFYYGLSIMCLHHYSQIIKSNFSNLEHYRLRWLTFLVSGLGALMFIDLGLTMISALLTLPAGSFNLPYLLVFECLYVFAMGVLAAKQAQIIFTKPIVEEQGRKYDRSSLNYQKAETLISNVQSLMQKECCYLDNELSLSDLATKLNASPVHLSQALNENLGKSFYDYINELRVEHCKTLLISPGSTDKNILDIAFASGFNNKTSFNKAFKKHTGVTPSQFRLQVNV